MYGFQDRRLKHIHLNFLLLRTSLVRTKLEEPWDLNAIKSHWRLPYFLDSVSFSFHCVHVVVLSSCSTQRGIKTKIYVASLYTQLCTHCLHVKMLYSEHNGADSDL